MAAKQYDLESSVLDWYRDFCPENSFDVQIRPDITFADVVVGMANGIDLSDLIGSDSEVFSNIVFVKLAEITGESYRTVANVWYEAPMTSLSAGTVIGKPVSRPYATMPPSFLRPVRFSWRSRRRTSSSKRASAVLSRRRRCISIPSTHPSLISTWMSWMIASSPSATPPFQPSRRPLPISRTRVKP